MSRSKRRKRESRGRTRADTSGGRPRRKLSWVIVVAAGVIAVLAAGALLRDEPAAGESPFGFTDVKKHTKEFIGYYNTIKLTPQQELVKQKALSRIPAPCCSDNTAYTCCCPCNMAKTWWGLSHHLIAEKGYGADEVQAAVEGWIDFIGPKGFSGNACYTGGCARPFHRNGCGGMSEQRVAF